MGGAADSRIDSQVLHTALMPTCTRGRHHLCVNQGIGEGVITANTYKSPIHASSLLRVPSCDKPVAYRRLENIKLSSL